MVIGNTCSAAYAYKYLKKQYDSPFIWNSIYAEDFYNLITNFTDIDFSNIKCEMKLFPRDSKERACITIDDVVDVFYIHHTLDKAKEKYVKRVSRLIEFINTNERPLNNILFSYSMFDDKNENPIYVNKLSELNSNLLIIGYKDIDGLNISHNSNVYNNNTYENYLLDNRIQLKHDDISKYLSIKYNKFF